MLVERKKIFLNLTPRIRIRSTTLLLLILFTLSINSYGQKIILSKWKKGFIALEHYDFFRARKLFIKSLKRHTAPAAFGLSLVHLDDLNYFHSLDSAYFRINQADSAFDKLEKKSKEKLKPYSLSDSALRLIRSEIFLKAWKNANNENSVSGFQHLTRIQSPAFSIMQTILLILLFKRKRSKKEMPLPIKMQIASIALLPIANSFENTLKHLNRT
jgi:hypothetical protein